MKNIRESLYLACFTISGLFFIGCSTPAPEPVPFPVHEAELLEATAINVMEAGNWKASEETWGEVARKYALLGRRDRQAIALHNQSYSAYRNGNYQSARALASEAASINLQGSEWWKNQILLLQIEQKTSQESRQKRMEELLSLAETSNLEEKETALWVLLQNEYGSGLLREGVADKANGVIHRALEKVNAVDRSTAWALNSNLAETEEALGRYDAALTSWNKLLEEAKELADRELIATALAGQGRSLWGSGRDYEAIMILQRAAKNFQWLGMEKESSELLELIEQYMIKSAVPRESYFMPIDTKTEYSEESQ
ncbi:MAG: tetratricopeptide repeat protein [Verrucomicrobia bacterium]|nr:tetratricopeptide repeat protein [Verrucomicrobiota bacterium]